MVDPESFRDILLVDYGFFAIISRFFLLCCRRFQREEVGNKKLSLSLVIVLDSNSTNLSTWQSKSEKVG